MIDRNNKLKKLLTLEGEFFKKYKNIGIRIGVASAILALTLIALPSSDLTPKKAEEYARTSVKVLSSTQGGGSGSILQSTNAESIILTNKHVCELITQGGTIEREAEQYLITEYKMSNTHDLCLVKVKQNLGVTTRIAGDAPKKYSEAHISGHPSLFPHVATHGNFSGRMIISVMLGLAECTEADYNNPETIIFCLYLGGVPIVEVFDSQLVTGTILPGSSGSAVFNEDGEIAGVVFASSSRELSFAFIVPQEYVKSFVDQEAPRLKWQRAKPKTKTTTKRQKGKTRLFKNPIYQEKRRE